MTHLADTDGVERRQPIDGEVVCVLSARRQQITGEVDRDGVDAARTVGRTALTAVVERRDLNHLFTDQVHHNQLERKQLNLHYSWLTFIITVIENCSRLCNQLYVESKTIFYNYTDTLEACFRGLC